jgi:hypothetical protein
MHCPVRTNVMLNNNSSNQTIEEGQGTLVMTTWRCRPYHQVYEEIWVSNRYRGIQPHRSFYPVKPISSELPAGAWRPIRARRVHAHACMG